MEVENRILLKENGRMFDENRNLKLENQKLKNRFQLFTNKLENLLDELKSETGLVYTGKSPRIFLAGDSTGQTQVKEGMYQA